MHSHNTAQLLALQSPRFRVHDFVSGTLDWFVSCSWRSWNNFLPLNFISIHWELQMLYFIWIAIYDFSTAGSISWQWFESRVCTSLTRNLKAYHSCSKCHDYSPNFHANACFYIKWLHFSNFANIHFMTLQLQIMILFPCMFAYFGLLGSKFMHNAYFEDFSI